MDIPPSRNPRLKSREFLSKPTVKQNLAAIRGLFDYLVTGGLRRKPYILLRAASHARPSVAIAGGKRCFPPVI